MVLRPGLARDDPTRRPDQSPGQHRIEAQGRPDIDEDRSRRQQVGEPPRYVLFVRPPVPQGFSDLGIIRPHVEPKACMEVDRLRCASGERERPLEPLTKLR